MSSVYIYVVDRDFGFAPNPYHGVCTLACCKPSLRSTARVGDWVFGFGGSRLKATGHCIYGMRVTQTMTFDDYWSNPAFTAKRPVRNGSRVMMLGDNIYYRASADASWNQLDSHHSAPDGSPNPANILNDTRINKVLASEDFVYFGQNAPKVPSYILEDIGYENRIGHRVFSLEVAKELVRWFEDISFGKLNEIVGDPFQFGQSGARYSVESNKTVAE